MKTELLYKVKLFINIAILIIAAKSLAMDAGVKFGPIATGGNGCPAGDSMGVEYDPFTGQLDLVPENYAAVAENGAIVARKSCQLTLPFKGQPGRAVRVTIPHLVGAVALDQSSTAEINYEFFSPGQLGPTAKLLFQGDENILEREFDEIYPEQELVYGCGESGMIRVNSSILLRRNYSALVSFVRLEKFGITVDTIPCYER